MTEADALLRSLDRAGSDAERAELLANRSPELLDAVNATLVYRKFIADVDADIAAEQAAFAAFEAELSAAADDSERVKLIGARDPAFVSEWAWQRTATDHDWHDRYQALLRGVPA